jgi:hypothetical protein
LGQRSRFERLSCHQAGNGSGYAAPWCGVLAEPAFEMLHFVWRRRLGHVGVDGTSPDIGSDDRMRHTGGNRPKVLYPCRIAAGFATNGRYHASSLGIILPCFNRTGLVAYLCRSGCSFRLPGVRRPGGFCLPKLNAFGAGYRSR